ncbi:hypothetical protein KI387_015645 [Taxus chinensis]|uniref:Pentatricopeptide repeat-containing protein n=1 Tax=Taxus chinensis TaxID=29808 RepID=A0AA38LEJ1_TAXCH|nr:hypothetical protein KI387_015645 [Taxus chinensis]
MSIKQTPAMGSLIIGNGATNASVLLSEFKQKGLGLCFCEKNGNGRNLRWGRKMQMKLKMKGVYCSKASQPRGPLWHGRVLSTEVMQAVQAMRRARGDHLKIQRVFDTTVSRFVKADLLAVLQELHRQNECHLALMISSSLAKPLHKIMYRTEINLNLKLIQLYQADGVISPQLTRQEDYGRYGALLGGMELHQNKLDYKQVFDIVRKEIWYKPDLSLYVSVISALKKNNLLEKVDPLFEELKKESLQPDTNAFTRLIATFLRVGLPQYAIETYELMKQTKCKMDDYTFAVLIKGLQRLREPDLADVVIKEYREFLNDPMGFLKDTTQDALIS